MKRSNLARSSVPLARSGPPRRRPKPQTTAAVRKKATALWSQYIHARQEVCQVCTKADGILQAHHIMVRSFNATRTDETNGVLCCFRCHRYFFHGTDPFKAACWYSNWLGVEGYEALRQKAYDGKDGRYPKSYWEAEVKRLSELLGEL